MPQGLLLPSCHLSAQYLFMANFFCAGLGPVGHVCTISRLPTLRKVSVVQAKLTSFKAAARLQLRTCLAHHLHLPLITTTIEGIKSGLSSSLSVAHCQQASTLSTTCGKDSATPQALAKGRPAPIAAAHAAMQPTAMQATSSGVTVAVHIQLGSAQQQGQQLAAALQTTPDAVLTDGEMNAAIGMVHAGSVLAEVVDVTPGLEHDACSSTKQADRSVPPQEAMSQGKELVEVRLG